MDSTGFHPVTAAEWNGFTAKIQEVYDYMGGGDIGFTRVRGDSTGYSSNPTTFTPQIYNEAVTGLWVLDQSINANSMYISDGTELTASLFTDLRDKLNEIIDGL